MRVSAACGRAFGYLLEVTEPSRSASVARFTGPRRVQGGALLLGDPQVVAVAGEWRVLAAAPFVSRPTRRPGVDPLARTYVNAGG